MNEKITVEYWFLHGITPFSILFPLNPTRCRRLSSSSVGSFLCIPLFSSFTMESKLHPALTVSNIKTHVPILLEKDSTHYTTWKTLFKVHCQIYEVLDHLSPKQPDTKAADTSDTAAAAKVVVDSLWTQLDAMVLQWIYSTISAPLLHIILQPGQTANDAWTAIESEFNDNKTTRAIFLGQEFANLSLDNFSSMSDYCDHAKNLADQLKSVGAPVADHVLVIKILTGLTEQYDGISTVLQNQDPLPSFNDVRSKLNLEENKKKRQATRASQLSALAAVSSASQPTRHGSSYSANERGRGRNRRGRGRGRSANGRGGRASSGYGQPSHQYPYIVFPQNWTQSQWAGLLHGSSQPWASPPSQPPCPYPSRPNNNSQGILGARPDQAHYNGYTPTDIEQALYTMSLNPPDHGLMDTGATAHSANQQGIYSPSNFNSCTSKHIIVGNGMSIPVLAQGNQDLKTRAPLLRCNSTGDLYPLTKPLPLNLSQPQAFATNSQDHWHQRLGHPGNNLLQSLKLSSFIDYGKLNKTLCQSCVFGKSVRLSFIDSINSTHLPFDIVDSDLWTSPVLSTGGHKYYILFLDNFTNFLWTFLIATKSQVFHIFIQFHNLINTQFERKIKQFQCDNGKEYANQNFYNFCHQNGMQFRFSCPYTSSQNGKAERKIRTINNMIRTLLAQASLPPNFWHHALETLTYLLNILPCKTQQFRSPTSRLYKVTPEYEHLRVFGVFVILWLPLQTFTNLTIVPTHAYFWGIPPIIEETIFPYTIQSPTKPPSYDFLNPTIHPLVWDNLLNTKPSPTLLAQQSSPPHTPLGPPSTVSHQPTPPSHNPAQTYSPSTTPLTGPPTHPPHHPTHQPVPSSYNPAQTNAPPTPHQPQSAQSSPSQPTDPSTTTGPGPSFTFDPSFPSSPTSPSIPVPPPPPFRTIQTRSMSGIVKPKQPFNLHTSTVILIPKNPQVALSIPEWMSRHAPFHLRGVANVVAELCWLRNLLLELHLPIARASLVYCDNVSAIYLSGNPIQHQRTKHIELDIHFVREQVQRGAVRVLHVPSPHQVADILTKGLPRVLFDDFRSGLSIRPPFASTAGCNRLFVNYN
uniref:Putative ribonuclease H-like domain, GAG-pre-integrase domain protein n=1 Tax=Helianthus annuus TaxID=4232 RepID=A0A251U9V3_HELAN